MLIRKHTFLLLLFALYAGADVFRTNEIPVVPAEDLLPPPEDQESILVRYAPNDLPSKSFLQRIVTWFGFNGDPQSQAAKIQNNKKPPQKQNQNGYVYENPAKPFSAAPQTSSYQPQKLQPQTGYTYEPPPQKLEEQPHTGYTYDPPPVKLQQQQISQQPTGYTYIPPTLKLQAQPTGYNYDPPPVKLQQLPNSQPETGYTYNPPPVKLQLPSPASFTYGAPPAKLQQETGYTYNTPPLKLQQQPAGFSYGPPPQKLQEQPKPVQSNGYLPPPLKLQQRPGSINDLVSSAASPTAVYAYNFIPPNQFSQAQSSDIFPCNKIPWLPMIPSADELNLLRARLQARIPGLSQSQPGYQNIQQIARPTPEKFTQQLNAHTYLPPRNQRPLRQPSVATPNQINSINALPLASTAQPFKVPSPTAASSYLPPQKVQLPIETTQHSIVPIPVPNLSVTPVPPLYDPKPFSLSDVQASGFYINGRLVTPTGLSTTSVQSLQIYNQNHPVTQSQKIVQPTSTYSPPAGTYGAPPVTYGPPTNTYGTPPVKLTAEVTESSVFSRFKASQPFTARPTLSTFDQTRLSSSNVEQNSNLRNQPIVISDSAADASESTRSPQDSNTISDDTEPILQVLQELNVTTTPQGLYAASTEPTLSSASQVKKKETKGSDRETPLDLLDSPIYHFRKTSIGPSSTGNPIGSRYPEFKFIRNTWKPLPPNPFSNPLSVVTTAQPPIFSSPVTPSAASVAFQSHTPHDGNAIDTPDNQGKKTKKIQIIIPYTSKGRPSPFKNHPEFQSFESSAGWSNSQHVDDHNSEESQVVSSATPSPKSSKKRNYFLTNVLANNIRELLKREHQTNISTIDLAKLQKNIDGWTEQEFSMSPNRASTISLLTQPKHIPFEYLTTTQSLHDVFTTEPMQPTTDFPTTLYEVGENTEIEENLDEGEGEVADDDNEDENEIRGSEIGDPIQLDEQEAIKEAAEIEDEDFKRLDYLKSLENNQVAGSEHRIFYATNPPSPKATTTPVPPCSTTTAASENESNIRTTVLPSADELWNRLKSLLSPSSSKEKEKVYIVTPQPYPYFESEKIVSDDDNEVVGSFKSPRFLVRPTPGASTGRASQSIARLTFRPRADRLKTTTVKTTWNELSSDPVTEIHRSSTHSHSIVNGHAHAQAFSFVTPHSFDDGQNIQVDEDDGEYATETHRRSLHEYKL